LYAKRSAPAHTKHRLRLLAHALPAFRTAAALSLQLRQWRDTMSNILDRVAQPLALCSPTGRVLHQNGAFARAVGGRDRERLADAIRRVSHGAAVTGTRERLRDSMVSDTSLSTSRWHIVGGRLGWEFDGKAPSILVSLLPRSDSLKPDGELDELNDLTKRELEVLRLLRLRRSNTEVARALGISAHTARHHTERVLAKLGLHSRREVEAYFETSDGDSTRSLTASVTADRVD
jgi:DNA-binding CsgD family transcriptional regulator